MNPTIVSLIVLIGLCLLRFNVLLAIFIAAIVAGMVSGFSIQETMSIFINSMGSNSKVALSYVLLGALAYAINQSGLAQILADKFQKFFGKTRNVLLFSLALVASLSQNLIPIHIAFIPILIPPLLIFFNKIKLDRRAVSCSLTFGLKAPYLLIPVGFGKLFHEIVANAISTNGLQVPVSKVWLSNLIPVIGMIVGLCVAILFTYKKPRTYDNKNIINNSEVSDKKVLNKKQFFGAILAIVVAFAIQLIFDSLPLGALLGIIIMMLFKTIEYKALDETINGGIVIMGYVAFVMLVAAGYSGVIIASDSVNELAISAVNILQGNQFIAAVVLLSIGLLVSMAIGSSFSTIPIIATIFVPICMELGFSIPATICLVSISGALGDAGSPASDSTLGPTSGLNFDGQHDHIRDTCIPTFLHFTIPLFIFALIASVFIL